MCPPCGLRRGSYPTSIALSLLPEHVRPLCSTADYVPLCTLAPSTLAPRFPLVSGCLWAPWNLRREGGGGKSRNSSGALPRGLKDKRGWRRRSKWPRRQAELTRHTAGERRPSSRSSDVTVIWHCLPLSNYGQFGSVTYPEITVIWVHLLPSSYSTWVDFQS